MRRVNISRFGTGAHLTTRLAVVSTSSTHVMPAIMTAAAAAPAVTAVARPNGRSGEVRPAPAVAWNLIFARAHPPPLPFFPRSTRPAAAPRRRPRGSRRREPTPTGRASNGSLAASAPRSAARQPGPPRPPRASAAPRNRAVRFGRCGDGRRVRTSTRPLSHLRSHSAYNSLLSMLLSILGAASTAAPHADGHLECMYCGLLSHSPAAAHFWQFGCSVSVRRVLSVALTQGSWRCLVGASEIGEGRTATVVATAERHQLPMKGNAHVQCARLCDTHWVV